MLDVAKTVIMDKLFVYNKADEVIDLSKDGKLEDVCSFTVTLNLFLNLTKLCLTFSLFRKLKCLTIFEYVKNVIGKLPKGRASYFFFIS